MAITVCERTVWLRMNPAGIYGLPGSVRIKRLRGVVTADDLVNRKFHRLRVNELWVSRRHSALGYRTPIEHELLSKNHTHPAVSQPPNLEPKRWGRSPTNPDSGRPRASYHRRAARRIRAKYDETACRAPPPA